MKYLGMSEQESYNVIKESVKMAKTACDRFLSENPESRKGN